MGLKDSLTGLLFDVWGQVCFVSLSLKSFGVQRDNGYNTFCKEFLCFVLLFTPSFTLRGLHWDRSSPIAGKSSFFASANVISQARSHFSMS